MAREGHPYTRSGTTGKRIAVIGAGPSGLACAHRLAMKGHDVVVFEARGKAGGLKRIRHCGIQDGGKFRRARN